MVNREHGLAAAKDQLRHADITITMQHYIAPPRKATSGIGRWLAPEREGKKIVEFGDGAWAHRIINRARVDCSTAELD